METAFEIYHVACTKNHKHYVSIVKIEKHKTVGGYGQFVAKNQKIFEFFVQQHKCQS